MAPLPWVDQSPPAVHGVLQLDWTHVLTSLPACEQADSISLATHEEAEAALAEYVPPGHAHAT